MRIVFPIIDKEIELESYPDDELNVTIHERYVVLSLCGYCYTISREDFVQLLKLVKDE